MPALSVSVPAPLPSGTVDKVRRLIGDNGAATAQQFSDTEIGEVIAARAYASYDVEGNPATGYDLWAAAADLLEMWSAATAGDVDADDGDLSLKRSQRTPARLRLASSYRAKQRIESGAVVRSDVC